MYNPDILRLSIGILGNAASLLLYTSPILTFSRVIRKKSTEDFSCIPYIITIFNCLLYTWYGLPIVSHLWENFPVASINGIGILLQAIFIFIYFYYASSKGKIWVGFTLVPVIVVFCVTTIISGLVLDDHKDRKVLVGSVGLVASVSMYASPLVAVRKVIETKSVEYMPFYLSFFSFIASSLWLAYGLLGHDLFLAAPNMVGSPLGILQLILYFKYKNKKNNDNEATTMVVKFDIENENGDMDQNKNTLELVINAEDKNVNNV